jgi:hypothetical protein
LTLPSASVGIGPAGSGTNREKRGSLHSAQWYLLILAFSAVLIWSLFHFWSYQTGSPSSQQTEPTASGKTSQAGPVPEPKPQPAAPPPVIRRLYIDSADMEEIIEANLQLRAAGYGFELVNSRLAADVILSGSAGLFKNDSFPHTCVPYYDFDVIKPRPRHRSVVLFHLSLGIPNNHPCIRFDVADTILAGLRDGLDKVDARGSSAAQETGYK